MHRCSKNYVCVWYFSNRNEITTNMFNLFQCFSNQNPSEAYIGATTELIYNKIKSLFESANIPFGCDDCYTMFGANNSVVSRIKLNLPGISIVQKCICNSLHLSASEACIVLPHQCKDLARNIYSHFKNNFIILQREWIAENWIN